MRLPAAPPLEQALDFLWAAASVGLAVETIQTMPAHRTAGVLLFLAIHTLTAILFLVRRPARAVPPGTASRAIAVASMLTVYLFDLDCAGDGPAAALGVWFVQIGTLLCLAATLNLGRNFAVMPSYRGLSTRGLYGIVRHPLYAAYLLVDLGFLAQAPSVANGTVFVASLGLLLARIAVEEELLAHQPSYEGYRAVTKYRLVPLVW